MTLFDNPQPERHRNKPTPRRRIDPDHLMRDDIEHLLGAIDIDGLTPYERTVVRQVAAESITSPVEICGWRGCTRPAAELHHTLPQCWSAGAWRSTRHSFDTASCITSL